MPLRVNLTPIFFLLGINTLSFGQDFFEDIKANGTPILQINACKKGLITPRLTTADGSIKINFFQWGRLQSDCPKSDQKETVPFDFGLDDTPPPPKVGIESASGFGINLKAKATDGLGTVFRSGNFTNGFTFGMYKAFAEVNKNPNGSTLTTHIISGNIAANSYRFFRSDMPVADQLTDMQTFVGFSASYSFLRKTSSGRENNDNLFWGGSVTVSRSDNYSSLRKTEIKNTTTYPVSSSMVRTTSEIDDAGYTYAVVDAKTAFLQPYFVQLRGHITFIPASLSHRVAFVFYPEVNHEINAKNKWNANFAIQFLKAGEPSASTVGLFVTFSDLWNASAKNQPFFNRSLLIGVTTAWDIFLAKRK